MKTKNKTIWTVLAVAALLIVGGLATATFAAKEGKKLYSLKSSSAVRVLSGKTGSTGFDIVPAKGAKVHPKAPFRCKVSATEGLKPLKSKLGRKDLAWKKNRVVSVKIPFKAQSKGSKQVKASCDFFICTKEICARKHEDVKLPVKVGKGS